MSSNNTFLRDLGDGLILRRSTKADADKLTEFNSHIHAREDTGEPDERVGAWTRDLLTQPHPTFNVGDFTIIEDINTGQIVSSLNLISQTWTYHGIPFGVGRPELVGTLPEYRNKGLIRTQFEIIHEWSQERGELLQAITGIPYYYRQFGYEMAVSLGGGRYGYLPQIPKLAEGQDEPYQVQPATHNDIKFIDQLYKESTKRYLLSCQWDEALWNYELYGKSYLNVNRSELRIIRNKNGIPIGHLIHRPYTWGSNMVAIGYELTPDESWHTVTPTIIRYLNNTGQEYAAKDGNIVDFTGFGFSLGLEHPVYEVFQDNLPIKRKPYTWYIRLADPTIFLQLIIPVLEGRLRESSFLNHTGELKITFYQSGIMFNFDQGRISINDWNPEPHRHSGDAAFPNHSFLQLIFGYRSITELDYAYADCWIDTAEKKLLLDVLFPKINSNIFPIS